MKAIQAWFRYGKWQRSAGLALGLMLLLTLVMVGCSSSAPSDPPASDSSAPAAPEASTPTEAAQPTAAPAAPPEAAATEPAARPTAAPEPVPTIAAAATTAPDPTATTAPSPEPTTAPEPELEPPASTGYVIGEGSKATFTVNETLAWLDFPIDAVMTTEGLSGVIYLNGPPTVIDLDLHSMSSDQDRRDGYVRTRMFPDDRTATFTVTDLGDLPDPLPEGEVIARQVPGELTILGATNPITFDVEARKDPDKLFVLGRTTFTWAELDIPPPNIPGRIQVKDEVRVEVLLSAVPNEG